MLRIKIQAANHSAINNFKPAISSFEVKGLKARGGSLEETQTPAMIYTERRSVMNIFWTCSFEISAAWADARIRDTRGHTRTTRVSLDIPLTYESAFLISPGGVFMHFSDASPSYGECAFIETARCLNFSSVSKPYFPAFRCFSLKVSLSLFDSPAFLSSLATSRS